MSARIVITSEGHPALARGRKRHHAQTPRAGAVVSAGQLNPLTSRLVEDVSGDLEVEPKPFERGQEVLTTKAIPEVASELWGCGVNGAINHQRRRLVKAAEELGEKAGADRSRLDRLVQPLEAFFDVVAAQLDVELTGESRQLLSSLPLFEPGSAERHADQQERQGVDRPHAKDQPLEFFALHQLRRLPLGLHLAMQLIAELADAAADALEAVVPGPAPQPLCALCTLLAERFDELIDELAELLELRLNALEPDRVASDHGFERVELAPQRGALVLKGCQQPRLRRSVGVRDRRFEAGVEVFERALKSAHVRHQR